jgi:hypothetical protein
MPKTSILASRGTGRDLPEQAPSTREAKTPEAVDAKLRIAEVVKKAD